MKSSTGRDKLFGDLTERWYVYPLTTRRTTTGRTRDNFPLGKSQQAMITNKSLPCVFSEEN
jgi:hypothetical protein